MKTEEVRICTELTISTPSLTSPSLNVFVFRFDLLKRVPQSYSSEHDTEGQPQTTYDKKKMRGNIYSSPYPKIMRSLLDTFKQYSCLDVSTRTVLKCQNCKEQKNSVEQKNSMNSSSLREFLAKGPCMSRMHLPLPKGSGVHGSVTLDTPLTVVPD